MGSNAKQKSEVTENSEPKAKQSRFWIYLSLVASLCSIVSVPLAVYFYAQGREAPRLKYVVNPAKAVVVSAAQASALEVKIAGREVKGDVTAAQVAIWNGGKKAIRRENVLQSVVLATENEVPILEASIRKTSRDICEVALDSSKCAEGKLGISWKILEQDDGAVVQVIYGGPQKTGIAISGVVEQQKEIEILSTRQGEPVFGPLPGNRTVQGMNFFLFSGLLLCASILSVLITRKQTTLYTWYWQSNSRIFRQLILGLAAIMGVGPIFLCFILGCIFLSSGPVAPPFGF